MTTYEEMKNLADVAKAAQWSSEAQITAENLFYDLLEDNLDEDKLYMFEVYSLKATVDERLDFGLKLFRENTNDVQ